jgi:hypothetical protein
MTTLTIHGHGHAHAAHDSPALTHPPYGEGRCVTVHAGAHAHFVTGVLELRSGANQ